MIILKHIILFALIIGILGGCGTSKNKKENQQPAETDSTVTADSMDFHPPPPAGPGLSPGTVRISGTVAKISETKMEIKVISVDEYGSATPVIGSNSMIEVSFPNSLKKEIQKLKKDKKIVCLLNYQQVLGSGNTQSKWIINNISAFED